jgi:hypothetical protein
MDGYPRRFLVPHYDTARKQHIIVSAHYVTEDGSSKEAPFELVCIRKVPVHMSAVLLAILCVVSLILPRCVPGQSTYLEVDHVRFLQYPYLLRIHDHHLILKIRPTVFWNMTLCGMVHNYRHFGGTCFLRRQGKFFLPQYQNSSFPRNFVGDLPGYAFTRRRKL